MRMMQKMESTFRILVLFAKLNWESNRSTPVNFMLAGVGMIINNLLFLGGMWVMLFSGKQNNAAQAPYFLALSGVVPIAWGIMQLFFGGLYALPHLIDEGGLDPWLATPRSPLLLAAASRSSPAAAGDIAQGVLILILLPWLNSDASWQFCLRAWLGIIPSTMGFAALMMICAALPFYIPRGSTLSYFFLETQIALSSYPTGKIFEGRLRWFLTLMPAGAIAILPMDWIETASAPHLFLTLVSVAVAWGAGLLFFHHGLTRYQSGNLISTPS